VYETDTALRTGRTVDGTLTARAPLGRLGYPLQQRSRGDTGSSSLDPRTSSSTLVVRLFECEHMFVATHGSDYSQFKRALERRNFMLAWTMAAELPRVPLADGLELLLLARDLEPARFDRAVPRWHARLCSEQQLSTGEAQLATGGPERPARTGLEVRGPVAGCGLRDPWPGPGSSGAADLAQSSLTTTQLLAGLRSLRAGH
jgi:hypothetical protein